MALAYCADTYRGARVVLEAERGADMARASKNSSACPGAS